MWGIGNDNISGAPAWKPTDLAGLVADYNFSNRDVLFTNTARTVPVVNAGDPIRGVHDLSGLGNHLSEATNPPTFQPGSIGGRPAGRGNGTSSQLKATVALTQPFAVFVVGKVTTPATDQYFFDGQTAATAVVGNTSATQIQIYAGFNILMSVPSNAMLNPHVIAALFSGASARGGFDGALVGGNTGTGNVTGITLFASGGGTKFLGGDLARCLVYSGALTNGDISTVSRYLGTEYGVAVA